MNKINKLKDNVVLKIRPELLDEWDFEKNNELGLDVWKITKGMHNIVWWNCPRCKSNYDMMINKRIGQNGNCPYCTGSRVNHTNSLASLNPNLTKDWHPTKNGELTPYDVTYGSGKKVWWKCSECKSDYDAKVNKRTSGQNCPYCSGKRANHTNSLAKKSPNLASEWHPTKNRELTTNDVTCGSSKNVWWLGKCGHEWEASISNRDSKGRNCPYCSNKKILKGFNDMWTTNPDLASMLLNPEDGSKYTQNSGKRLDWKCPDCNIIVKNKRITAVNKLGIACPRCSDGISLGEKILYNVLLINKIEFLYDNAMQWSNNRRYDFYLPKYNMIIEVHGAQHYRMNSRGRSLVYELNNDLLKEHLAKENGIKHYIVIDARKSDFEYIADKIMKSKIRYIIKDINFDFKKVASESRLNFIKTICMSWESSVTSTKELEERYKINRSTVIRYLKIGNELDWCNYIPTNEIVKNGIKNGSLNAKKIVQLDLNDKYIREWSSVKLASTSLNISKGNISSVLKGSRLTAGGYKWIYSK